MATLYSLEPNSCQPPLTGPEETVIEWFDKRFDDSWSLIVRPHLNGLCPDIAMFHEWNGLGLFDVIGSARDLAAPEGGEHPLDRQKRMRDTAGSLLSPAFAGAVAENYGAAMRYLTCGIIDPARETKGIYASWTEKLASCGHLSDSGWPFYPISGGDALGPLRSRVYTRHDAGKTPLGQLQAEQFRSWLIPVPAGRMSLMMSPEQRVIAQSRPATGFRRIRGSAGSGKSQVLAARAAELAAQGKRVLVLSFNITAWHPLRDLAMQWPIDGNTNVHRITWLHFNAWCTDRIHEAGLASHLPQVYSKHHYETDIPRLCRTALARTGISYDAILVDEAHDFSAEWWDTALAALAPDGEAMLVADSTQNLFGNAWTDSSMTGSGFTERWIEAPFQTGHRMPPQLIPHVHRFIATFPSQLGSLAIRPAQRPALDRYSPFHTQWIHIGESGDLASVASATTLQAQEDATREGIDGREIVLLCQDRDMGRNVRDELIRKGIPVQHIFGDCWQEERRLKIAFSQDDPRMKASTVKSFRGWQARKVILLIDRADNDAAFREIYVGLTRVKAGERGASLTVISRPDTLLDFALGWPNFIDARPAAAKPEPRPDEGFAMIPDDFWEAGGVDDIPF
jgi:hypothetical protein